jgi:hypothetical protein
MVVDFFIAGVQKAGTTALDAMLRRHPEIQMARVKEVHHFDDERIDWARPDHSRLHGAFDWSVSGVVRGEATPVYTYWPDALSRLRQYNPRSRLIVGLRHPSFRAFSHWRMEKNRLADPLPFDEAISAAGRRRVHEAPQGVHRVFSYVERGYYSTQVTELLRLFPRDKVLFFRTDELWERSKRVLADVQDFLGVQRLIEARQEYIVPLVSEKLGDIGSGERAVLDDLFAEDVKATGALTDLDLSDWLDPSYREPMLEG